MEDIMQAGGVGAFERVKQKCLLLLHAEDVSTRDEALLGISSEFDQMSSSEAQKLIEFAIFPILFFVRDMTKAEQETGRVVISVAKERGIELALQAMSSILGCAGVDGMDDNQTMDVLMIVTKTLTDFEDSSPPSDIPQVNCSETVVTSALGTIRRILNMPDSVRIELDDSCSPETFLPPRWLMKAWETSAAKLGYALAVLLAVARGSKVLSGAVSQQSLEILAFIFEYSGGCLERQAYYLPGIASACSRIIHESGSKGTASKLIGATLDLWGKVLQKFLNPQIVNDREESQIDVESSLGLFSKMELKHDDKTSQPVTSTRANSLENKEGMAVVFDEAWVAKADENMSLLLQRVLGLCTTHPSVRVRGETISFLEILLCSCTQRLMKCNQAALQALASLLSDDNLEIKRNADAIVCRLKASGKLIKMASKLQDEVDEMVAKLPSKFRCEADDTIKSLALRQIFGFFIMLDSTGSLTAHLSIRMRSTLSAFLACLPMDTAGIIIQERDTDRVEVSSVSQSQLERSRRRTRSWFLSTHGEEEDVRGRIASVANACQLPPSLELMMEKEKGETKEGGGKEGESGNEEEGKEEEGEARTRKEEDKKLDSIAAQSKALAAGEGYLHKRFQFFSSQTILSLFRSLFGYLSRKGGIHHVCKTLLAILKEASNDVVASSVVLALNMSILEFARGGGDTESGARDESGVGEGNSTREATSSSRELGAETGGSGDGGGRGELSRQDLHSLVKCVDLVLDNYLQLSRAYSSRLLLSNVRHSARLRDVSSSWLYSEVSVDKVLTACLLLEGIGDFAEALASSFDPCLLKVIFPILSAASLPSTHVSDAAMQTIRRICRACEYEDATALVRENADYLIDNVCRNLVRGSTTKSRTSSSSSSSSSSSADARDNDAALLRACHALLVILAHLNMQQGSLLEDTVEAVKTALEVNVRGWSIPLAHVLPAFVAAIVEGSSLGKSRSETEGSEEKKREQHTCAGDAAGDRRTDLFLEEEERHGQGAEELQLPSSRRAAPPDLEARACSMLYSIFEMAESLLGHSISSVRSSALITISAVSFALRRMPRELHPRMHVVWPLLCRRLMDKEPSLRVQASSVLAACVRDSPDFLADRALSHFAPVASEVLQEEGQTTWQKAQRMALLHCLSTMAVHVAAAAHARDAEETAGCVARICAKHSMQATSELESVASMRILRQLLAHKDRQKLQEEVWLAIASVIGVRNDFPHSCSTPRDCQLTPLPQRFRRRTEDLKNFPEKRIAALDDLLMLLPGPCHRDVTSWRTLQDKR